MSSNFQSESSECGLASLAMVASGHGLHIGLPELRRRFPLSWKGAKPAQLIRIAQPLGCSTRALRLDLDDHRAPASPDVRRMHRVCRAGPIRPAIPTIARPALKWYVQPAF